MAEFTITKPKLTIGLLRTEVPEAYHDQPSHVWLSFQMAEVERRILDIEEQLRALNEVVQP